MYRGNFENRFYLRNQELDAMWEALIVPPGHYSSVADVIYNQDKRSGQRDKRFKDEVQLSLDTLNRKVTVHLQNKVEVYFSDIGQMLGFSPNKVISKPSTGEREADLDHGFHDLYVYCDIIQPQYAGDALVPLLRIVPVQGKDGQRISRFAIPVSRKQFETIEVNIKRDTGETVPFEFGRVLLTLHFRKSRPVNF